MQLLRKITFARNAFNKYLMTKYLPRVASCNIANVFPPFAHFAFI